MRWLPGLPGGFEAGLIAISITAIDTVAGGFDRLALGAEPGQRHVPGRIRTSYEALHNSQSTAEAASAAMKSAGHSSEAP